MHNIRMSVITLLIVSAATALCAAQARLKAIPGELEMRNGPVSWSVGEGDSLTIKAAKNTNWFISPLDLKSWDSAPTLLFRPAEDFVLSARMSLQPHSRWDGGALVLFDNETTWAKLCLEAPDSLASLSVVMVVTRGESDDSYSIPVAGNSMYMKIAKIGPAFAFYVSADGRSWQMVRAFRLGTTRNLRAGFLAQSPTGEGSAVSFADIHYGPTRVTDIFKGE